MSISAGQRRDLMISSIFRPHVLADCCLQAPPHGLKGSGAKSHGMRRDAPKHNSPNAGWPESALAASLGVKFGGPRRYEGHLVNLPWMGEGRETLNRDDIRKGLRFYGIAMTFLLFLVAFCAAFF